MFHMFKKYFQRYNVRTIFLALLPVDIILAAVGLIFMGKYSLTGWSQLLFRQLFCAQREAFEVKLAKDT